MRLTPLLLTLLGSVGLVASVATASAAPAPAKFLGYNIFVDTHGTSWQTRREGFHAFLKANDFDVVALQEVGEPQIADIVTRQSAYDYVVGDRSDGYRGDQGWYEFSPILWKRDRYTLQRHGSFWVSETPDVPGSILPGTKYHGRTFNWTILRDRKTQQDVLVGNIHIHGLRSADEIRIIRDRLKALAFDGPIVLLGDFNMTPQDAGYPYITKELGFTDAGVAAAKVTGPKRTIISGPNEFIRTAGIFWNGSGIESHGVRMSHYQEYVDAPEQEGEPEVAQFGEWLDLPAAKRPHFYALVLAQADHAGHSFGQGSPQLEKAVREIDGQIGEIRAALKARKIDADVVVVSDHGMSDIVGDWINLDTFADLSHAKTAGAYIYPDSEAAAQKIYDQLKGASPAFDVYRRKDLPTWLHYSDDPLAGDPVIVPRGPYLIRAHDTAGKGDKHPGLVGLHGDFVGNNVEMRASFIAAGPHIKQGVALEPFRNVNVYPMVTTLLGLKPAVSDGSCLLANQILKDRPACELK